MPELDEKEVAQKDARIRSFAIAQVCMLQCSCGSSQYIDRPSSHMSSCSKFHRTANLMHSCWAHLVFTARQHPRHEDSERQSTSVMRADFEDLMRVRKQTST